MWWILEKGQEYKIVPEGGEFFNDHARNGWVIFSGPYKTYMLAHQHIPKE